VVLCSVKGTRPRASALDCARAGRLLRVQATGEGAPAVYATSDVTGYQVGTGGDEPGVPLAAGTPVRPLRALDSDATVDAIIDPAALPAGVVPRDVELAVPTEGSDPEIVRTAMAGGGKSVDSREISLTDHQPGWRICAGLP
jgi:hypothetical protein